MSYMTTAEHEAAHETRNDGALTWANLPGWAKVLIVLAAIALALTIVGLIIHILALVFASDGSSRTYSQSTVTSGEPDTATRVAAAIAAASAGASPLAIQNAGRTGSPIIL